MTAVTAAGRPGGVATPVGLAILAMISVQTGASIAKHLLPLVGATGATTLRLLFGAVILLAVTRPWRGGLDWGAWRRALPYGLALGGMNLTFYASLKTLPIGIAVALEFTGPLAVAVFASRRPLDFLWVAFAVIGLVALLPLGAAAHGIDPVGAGFALGAGVFWALYIIFGQKAGREDGIRTVALGTTIAAIAVAPIGIATAGATLLTPAVIPLAVGVAILSTAIPYMLEMVAMTRLPARVFGTLMSLEPAIGAFAGLLLLGEVLGLVQWGAIAAIVVASLGSTLTIARPEQRCAPEPIGD